MEGVREYAENFPDLLDVIEWIKAHMPELLQGGSMKIDPRIIAAISAEGGATVVQLEALDPKYRDQIIALVKAGYSIVAYRESENADIKAYGIEEEREPVDPVQTMPPSVIPPAEAPATVGLSEDTTPTTATIGGMPPGAFDYPLARAFAEDAMEVLYNAETHFLIEDFKIQSRSGKATYIRMKPLNNQDVAAAFDFCSRVQPGADIEVTVRMQRIPPEGAEDMVQPKDYKSIQINPSGTPPNEKDPTKKSKQQLEKELSDQVKTGELSPALANNTAKLAGL
jgi:hypothetical protein